MCAVDPKRSISPLNKYLGKAQRRRLETAPNNRASPLALSLDVQGRFGEEEKRYTELFPSYTRAFSPAALNTCSSG